MGVWIFEGALVAEYKVFSQPLCRALSKLRESYRDLSPREVDVPALNIGANQLHA
jgi:hypothetical protein